MPSLYLALSYNVIASLQEVKFRHSANLMSRLRIGASEIIPLNST